MLKKLFNSDKGFTMTEMVIVMAVLAVLGSATLPKVYEKYDQFKIEKTAAEMRAIQVAAQAYYGDVGFWPASVLALQNTGYLPAEWTVQNSWAQNYTISNNGVSLAVTTNMPKKYNTALRNYLTSVVDDANCATDYCVASSTVPVPGLSIAPGSSTYSTPLQTDGSTVMTGNLQVQGDTSTGGTAPDGPGIKLIEKDSVGGNDLIAQIKDVVTQTFKGLIFTFKEGTGAETQVASLDSTGNFTTIGGITTGGNVTVGSAAAPKDLTVYGNATFMNDSLRLDKAWTGDLSYLGAVYTAVGTIELPTTSGYSAITFNNPGSRVAIVTKGPFISTESGAYFAQGVTIGGAGARVDPASILEALGRVNVNNPTDLSGSLNIKAGAGTTASRAIAMQSADGATAWYADMDLSGLSIANNGGTNAMKIGSDGSFYVKNNSTFYVTSAGVVSVGAAVPVDASSKFNVAGGLYTDTLKAANSITVGSGSGLTGMLNVYGNISTGTTHTITGGALISNNGINTSSISGNTWAGDSNMYITPPGGNAVYIQGKTAGDVDLRVTGDIYFKNSPTPLSALIAAGVKNTATQTGFQDPNGNFQLYSVHGGNSNTPGNLWFPNSTASSGTPGNNQGKVEYKDNTFNFVAGANSTKIASFGYGGNNDLVTIGIDGSINAASIVVSANSLRIGTLSGVLKASGGTVSGNATTSDLFEGSNLYYTDARARAALSASGNITYDSATGVIGMTANPTFTNVYATEFYSNSWFRNNNSLTGLYNQTNGNHFYSETGTRWTITGNGNTYGGLNFRDNHQSIKRGTVYFDTSGFGLLSSDDNWKVRVDNSGVELYGTVKIGALSGVLKASGGTVSGGATTSDLPEGSNLYFTEARARAALSATGNLNYNSTTGVIGMTATPTFTSVTATNVYAGTALDSGWFRNYGMTGLYNHTYDGHFYRGASRWTIAGGDGLVFRAGHEATITGYVYWANIGGVISFGLLSPDGNWKVRVENAGVQLYGSVYAPIYYDSDSVLYYANPGGTSRFNDLIISSLTNGQGSIPLSQLINQDVRTTSSPSFEAVYAKNAHNVSKRLPTGGFKGGAKVRNTQVFPNFVAPINGADIPWNAVDYDTSDGIIYTSGSTCLKAPANGNYRVIATIDVNTTAPDVVLKIKKNNATIASQYGKMSDASISLVSPIVQALQNDCFTVWISSGAGAPASVTVNDDNGTDITSASLEWIEYNE